MAKIILNNKEYQIDDATLAPVADSLKSHLSTVMNGEGAVIALDGVEYGIDATKLSAAKNDFVIHLGTIAGSGAKIMIGGVEYGVDSAKVAGAVTGLEMALSEASKPKPSEGLEFTSNGDGTCYVSGIGSCADADLVIPSASPEGDKVTSIGFEAFGGNQLLTSVVIPEGVTVIDEYAFGGCENLTSVVIPSSVLEIYQEAFIDCGLTSVTFNGTIDQWNSIKKYSSAFPYKSTALVQCTDGQVALPQ